MHYRTAFPPYSHEPGPSFPPVKQADFEFLASLDPFVFEQDFEKLFICGRISDRDLDQRVAKLSSQFKVFAATCHLPLWTNGLVITEELCRITEIYLGYDVIKSALTRLIRLSLRGAFVMPPLLVKADGWVRLLETLKMPDEFANPASLIAHLAESETDRHSFLFSLYLPEQFGGSFGRYPRQADFIKRWVAGRCVDSREPVACLDAACGSGEGSYELAGLLVNCGVDASRIRITGITLNPLEVFAAAHAYFPHEPRREGSYRRVVNSLTDESAMPRIVFRTADLKIWNPSERFGIVICNGFLGGPMLHESDEIENVVSRLAASLHCGGVLLASDRFHDGWKKVFPRQKLEMIFTKCGLQLLLATEGVAGVRRWESEL